VTDVVSENSVVRRTPEKLSWWEDHQLAISKMSFARKMSRTARIINASHPSMQGIHCPSDGHESPAREPGLCPMPDLSIECGMQHLTRRMALFITAVQYCQSATAAEVVRQSQHGHTGCHTSDGYLSISLGRARFVNALNKLANTADSDPGPVELGLLVQ
jgi:hypothetical protein